MVKPFLAATLIVKDEIEDLPGCLESLKGVVEEVVVYDTGSTDGTQDLARDFGARVEQGFWDNDFARARNAALALTEATWALAVDADERLVCDLPALRQSLVKAKNVDLFSIRIHNIANTLNGEGYEHPAPRLLRRDRMTWTSPLHERPVRLDGRFERSEALPREILRLDHLGYALVADVTAKVQRNVDIAQSELDAIVAQAAKNPRAVAYALLNYGRSCIGAGRVQDAVDALETLRSLFPASNEARIGTDALATLLLDTGFSEVVPGLAEELRSLGVSPSYCSFLTGRALINLGRYEEALVLFRGIDELYDSANRKMQDTVILEARMHAAGLAGILDEAAACLCQLMAGHGLLDHRPLQLLQIAGTAPVEYAAEMLLMADRGYLDQVLEALRALPAPGPQTADAVIARRRSRDGLRSLPEQLGPNKPRITALGSRAARA